LNGNEATTSMEILPDLIDCSDSPTTPKTIDMDLMNMGTEVQQTVELYCVGERDIFNMDQVGVIVGEGRSKL